MASWIGKTFWIRTLEDDCEFYQAVFSEFPLDDVTPYIADDAEGVQVTAAKDFPFCQGCNWMEQCLGSKWEDDLRVGYPDVEESSKVFLCRSCMQPILSFHEGDLKKIVPESCLRLMFHWALEEECDHCRTRRASLRSGEGALRKQVLDQALGETLREETQNKILSELDGLGAVFTISRIGTLFPILGIDSDKPEEKVKEAQKIIAFLMHHITNRFGGEWDSMGSIESLVTLVDWVLQIVDSRTEDIAYDFLLLFTDHPVFYPAWVKTTTAERRLIRRMWHGVVRQITEDS